MLRTLQWYIFREMGKTFLLSALGLTVVLSMGGGVLNLVEHEQVTPMQLLRVMLIVLPMAGSLTLPIAALYSATITYGRLSADNELVACRSSGINVHRLFLPTLTLSLLVAMCTFYFTSFLVPTLIRDLTSLASSGMSQLVVQQLDSPKRLGFPGMPAKFYADHTKGIEGANAVALGGVAFLKVENDTYTQYGTAEAIVIRFGRTEHGEITVAGTGVNATVFDENGVADSREQEFGPHVIREQIRTKIKWLDLAELIHFRRNPSDWPKVAAAVAGLRSAVTQATLYTRLREEFATDSQITLRDDRSKVTLQAETLTVSNGDGELLFDGVKVVELCDGRARRITGDHAELTINREDVGQTHIASLRLEGNVSVTDSVGSTQRKGTEHVAGVAMNDPDDSALLDPDNDVALGAIVAKHRAELLHNTSKFVRRVTSELHSRLAFSVSVFVLVILGAALGVVFRGSHVLIAFGISFVPAMFVIVLNIMGRQLAEKEGTVLLGICTIWGSILVVALLDLWTLARGVRR